MESTAAVTDLADLGTIRQAAEGVMPPAYRDFVNNADMERTLIDDIAAWSALRLRPRALVDVSHVDTSLTLLGQPVSMPIVTAPFIGSTLVHPDGEVATARGALAAGTITTLSMNGTRTPEQVGAVAAGRYWQQVYWVRDRDIVRDIVERAVASGASALCLTVDLPVMPAFAGRMKQAAAALNESWVSEEHGMYPIRDYRHKPFGSSFPDPSITWADLEWLQGLSDLPLILKGVIRPEDAVLARDHGAAAVVVSNHGTGAPGLPACRARPARDHGCGRRRSRGLRRQRHPFGRRRAPRTRSRRPLRTDRAPHPLGSRCRRIRRRGTCAPHTASRARRSHGHHGCATGF